MDKLEAYMVYMALMSATTERAIQIFKIHPWFSKLLSLGNGKVAQLFSTILSIVLVYLVGAGPFEGFIKNPFYTAIVIGLLISSTSGIWHDLIKLLQDTRAKVAASATVEK